MSHKLPDGIEIKKQYDTIPRLMCQPGEINQVFMNVLENAVDAIDGEGKITASSPV